jgi:hypothetical protein
MSPDSNIESIVRRLKSHDAEERQAAAEQLLEYEETGLSFEEGLKALEAAATDFPPGESVFDDSAADLVLAASFNADEAYLSTIVALYPRYTEPARACALSLVGELESREAAEAFVNLVQNYGWPETEHVTATSGLMAEPRHADVFFPALLQCAPESAGEYEIYRLCLEMCRAGLLAPDMMRQHESQLLSAYSIRKARLMAIRQEGDAALCWEEDYQTAREEAALLLDLLGFVDTPSSRNELAAALEHQDPRLASFAALSLLRLGEPVDQACAHRIAASHEMRRWLYSGLEELGRLDLFPQEYLNQEALAYSDMVNWLCFPTELAREPDEIELMKTFVEQGEPSQGVVEHYLFRFRTHPPHWSAKEGWLAGIAGPFYPAEGPSPSANGTFSAFQQWDSKTPEEHFRELCEPTDAAGDLFEE